MAYLNERLLKTVSGPTLDLPPQEFKEKKFNGRCRLYIGNLDPSITEEEFKALFVNYGETSELYINKEKNFAFIRLVGKFFYFFILMHRCWFITSSQKCAPTITNKMVCIYFRIIDQLLKKRRGNSMVMYLKTAICEYALLRLVLQ